jgi:hypothetical protein
VTRAAETGRAADERADPRRPAHAHGTSGLALDKCRQCYNLGEADFTTNGLSYDVYGTL